MATQAASPQGDHNIIVQAHGDGISVTVGLPHLTLVPWQNRVRHNPQRDIQILDPLFRAVPLVGRESDMSFLLGWLGTGDIADIKVTALIGQGGAGKTRLGLELLEQMPAGWDAGILTDEEARRFIEHSDLSAWGWRRPTLILVDYAAALTLTLAAWLRGLADHASPKHPLRILLLERHADLEGGWYSSLFDTSRQPARVQDFFAPLEPRKLARLDAATQRWSVLDSGIKAAKRLKPDKPAPVLPSPGTDPWFDKRLADPQWADPLLLLMAALVAFDNGLAAALSLSRPDLARELAKKEERRLRHSFDHRNPQSEQDADFLVHLYACVILCGGLGHDRLLDLAEQESKALRVVCSGGPRNTVTTLERLTGGFAAIPTMSPDLLAEAFWLGVFARLGSGAIAIVQRILPFATEKVIEVLTRSATDYSRVGDKLALAALNAIADDPEVDLALLRQIADALPQDTLALQTFALGLTRRLVGRSRSIQLDLDSPDAVSSSTFLGLLINYSNRQSDMGDNKGALDSITEAVTTYRELASANPDRFLPDLAVSLNNLSNRQSDMGDRAGALDAITESVNIRREPAATDPDRYLPDLALSLSNLSIRQSDMGDLAGALDSIVEAVNILRELAATNPDRFLPDLAMSLNNLSNRQSAMGDRTGALDSITEGVNTYRDLAAANPDRFLPDLAGSLNNLSNRQSDMGDRAGALDSITEAVDTYRDLAAVNPDRFLPDLAQSLNNLSNWQSNMGDRSGALDSITEAVNIRRELAVANPDRFLPNLANSLANLSIRRSGMGDLAGALDCIIEAVTIYRELVSANPNGFRTYLAQSLSIQGDHLAAVDRLQEARDAAAESLKNLAPHFTRYPKSFQGFAPATVKDYLVRSRELHLEPDEELLLPYQALIEEYNLRPNEGTQ